MARGNPENLRAAAQRKRQAATERAKTALDALIADGEPITFRGLAKTAGRVDRLPIPLAAARPRRAAARRAATHAARPAHRPELNEPPSQSNVVRALTAQITELKQRHRAETEHLQAALAAAQGENLELRRQLGRQAGVGRLIPAPSTTHHPRLGHLRQQQLLELAPQLDEVHAPRLAAREQRREVIDRAAASAPEAIPAATRLAIHVQAGGRSS